MKPRAPHSQARERGAALITVVMMVAIMSALAITVVETARLGLRRTANNEQMDTTRWYLLGAEMHASGLIDQAAQQGDSAAPIVADWLDRPIVFPLDDGLMQVTVSDGSNCFNLNGVVIREESGRLAANPDGMTRFGLLLQLSGVQNFQGLAAALADWIDSDNEALPGGAEAPSYRDDGPRPPNTLMNDRSELARVAGFDPNVIARIAPMVCTRPRAVLNPVNIETLRPDQARLLSAAVGRELTLIGADQIVAARPQGGWGSIEAFFADPRMAPLQLTDETKSLLVRRSNWYVVGMRVQVGDVAETSLALVSTLGGRARTVRRVFGVGSRERQL
jgi:general secretion pathway protein K